MTFKDRAIETYYRQCQDEVNEIIQCLLTHQPIEKVSANALKVIRYLLDPKNKR